MFISAKKIVDGDVKGKAYEYKADDSVNVGDIVIAPFGKSEMMLQVVEINIDPKKFEDLTYDIKNIVGVVDEDSVVEECIDSEIIELEILSESLPIIETNYEAVKAGLMFELAKYKSMVVTDQTLTGCKQTQRQLSGLKKKIDAYRLEKKKLFSAPIVEFENKCKELIALVDSVELPIKKGIAVFDDDTRNDKRNDALEIIKTVVAEYELTEKYAKQITVIDKYMNLSESKKNTTEDIKQRAMMLKIEQDRENELLGIIRAAISNENTRINQKLSLADFQRLISLGSPTADILSEVKKQADMIYKAENTPKEEPIIQEVVEIIPPKQILVEETLDKVLEIPSNPISAFAEHEEKEAYVLVEMVGSKEIIQQTIDAGRLDGLTIKVIEDGFM